MRLRMLVRRGDRRSRLAAEDRVELARLGRCRSHSNASRHSRGLRSRAERRYRTPCFRRGASSRAASRILHLRTKVCSIVVRYEHRRHTPHHDHHVVIVANADNARAKSSIFPTLRRAPGPGARRLRRGRGGFALPAGRATGKRQWCRPCGRLWDRRAPGR